jgi:alkylation response protein AidB-like acyl-CoA dehydrogenase
MQESRSEGRRHDGTQLLATRKILVTLETNRDTPEQEAFRAYCRAWLEAHTPAPPSFKQVNSGIEIVTEEQLDYYRSWQMAAYGAGLIGCDYPKEYGGGGRKNCQIVANQEMLRAKTPIFAGAIGLGMAAPVIFIHGTEDLKKRFLPPLFSGEELWCQGFSEPGAGSDLASVQTFAERKGNSGWAINGHKVWTSTAQFASWMILLARTDRADKYDGLTYFVAPIKSELGKSVTVRPLIKITGEAGFNEVLLENLEIDDTYRIDAVGKGWQVAMTTLAHERGAGDLVSAVAGGQASATSVEGGDKTFSLLKLAAECRRNGAPAIEDPVIRDRVMNMLIRQTAIKQHRRLRGVPSLADPQRLSLQDKLLGTEYAQDLAALALDIEGAAGTLSHVDPEAPDDGKWPLAYLSSFMGTIAGGTNEIQKNILGERVLGLARTK